MVVARARAANVGDEAHEMLDAAIAWGRDRFGDVRALFEKQLGRRRIDLLLVGACDVVGVEVKGPRDSLDRLEEQMREYAFYLPEVWVLAHERWRDHREVRSIANRAIWSPTTCAISVDPSRRTRRQADRCDLSCARLLEILWTTEVENVCRRTTVPFEYAPGKPFRRGTVLSAIARMLTGQEIMREVCAELRARPLAGIGSDAPLERSGESA